MEASQALVPVVGDSLPTADDFERAAQTIEAICKAGDAESLYAASGVSAAAAVYHARNEHKGIADGYLRLRVLAEAALGEIDIYERPDARQSPRSPNYEPLVIGRVQIPAQTAYQWRTLGIAQMRGLLTPIIDELLADNAAFDTPLRQAISRSGALWVPARPLREAFKRSGLTVAEVARRLGLSHGRVSVTLNSLFRVKFLSARQYTELLGVDIMALPPVPNALSKEDQRRRRVEVERRKNAMRAALNEKEQNQAIKRAVRKAGGAMAELYASTERMQDVLGQAHREATDSEARVALSLAGEHYRAMRDEIVRALGVDRPSLKAVA